ncbi:hypothetical protein ANO11243_082670 [Dothideomycetidae sp. 11243]|nr:hypothetical protein ANO11243_082670 [fungal sp. No.11243]
MKARTGVKGGGWRSSSSSSNSSSTYRRRRQMQVAERRDEYYSYLQLRGTSANVGSCVVRYRFLSSADAMCSIWQMGSGGQDECAGVNESTDGRGFLAICCPQGPASGAPPPSPGGSRHGSVPLISTCVPSGFGGFPSGEDYLLSPDSAHALFLRQSVQDKVGTGEEADRDGWHVRKGKSRSRRISTMVAVMVRHNRQAAVCIRMSLRCPRYHWSQTSLGLYANALPGPR